MKNENVTTLECCSGKVKKKDVVSETIKEFYNSAATGDGPYSSQTNKFSPSAPTQKIIECIHKSDKKEILDLGCGMGTTLIKLVKEYKKGELFIGVDFSDQMIKRARENSLELSKELQEKLGFFVTDVQELPYMNNKFDLIYSECVLNLVPNRDKVMSEVNRVLKPGGTFIYTDFASLKPVPEEIRRNLSLVSGCRAGSIMLEENISLMKEYGFSNVKYIDFTEDKNKRYSELRSSSSEINQEFKEFQNNHPRAAKFLDEKVGYYLFMGEKK